MTDLCRRTLSSVGCYDFSISMFQSKPFRKLALIHELLHLTCEKVHIHLFKFYLQIRFSFVLLNTGSRALD